MKSIGKYQVIEELGTSAAGTTCRARDSFRKSEFAVKVLHSGAGLTPEARDQFCRDLADCGELTHRHLAKVHDLGEIEEGIYVASELLTGVDMGRFMRENRELPIGQKLGVVAQVAEGLAFVHSRNFAHGDIKPSNILVDAARNATILDFGIGKWLASVLAAGSRLEGLLPNYFAPEQVLGQPFDARSDLFALGLILYEFLAGKYPFDVAPGLVPREIVHTDPAPLRKLDARIPAELEQLLARVLDKNPEKRLQTAEEFAAGLYAVAQELRRAEAAAAPFVQPVEAPPAPSGQPTAFETPKTLEVETVPVAPPPTAAAPVETPAAPAPPAAAAPAAPPMVEAMIAEVAAPPAGVPVGLNPPAARPARPAPPQGARPAGAPPRPAPRPAALKKPAKSNKRVVAIVAGAVLAVSIAVAFVSRQSLTASPKKSQAPAATQASPAAVDKPLEAPNPAALEPPAVTPSEPPASAAAAAAPENLEPSAKQILSGPVRSLWESGKYAQALGLVNQVLASDPENAEARVWKKKIRDAQAAEAALK